MMVLLTECIVCNPHLSHRRNCSQRVQIWEALLRVCQTVDPGVAIRNLALTVHLIFVFRDRKLSTSSTGNMKSKWVNAFKNIKGKQEAG